MKQTNEIAGWFDYPETFKKLVNSVPDGGIFVEGGAWLGKSSSFLCDLAGDRINVYIVDTWKGSPDELTSTHKLATERDIFQIFKENMGDRKYKAIRKDSIEASKTFEDASCDVVFIDMTHQYEYVLNDIVNWLPKVKLGGWLAGHDAHYPDVRRALKDGLKHSDEVLKLENCWLYKNEKY